MVTRLNGTSFAVNPDLIARAHASPDSTLIMVDGSSYTVTETLDELANAIVEYRARVIQRAQSLSPSDPTPFTPRQPIALDRRRV